LIGALRESGPCSIRALAGKLGRNYKNVHTDISMLEQWMAVERLDDGRVTVPWDEISVDMELPHAVAA
jgi:predicted transcriptional regulator